MRGRFIITKKCDVDELNKHYRKCYKDNIPYAVIRKKTKYAHLSVDLICIDHSRDLTESQRNAIRDLFNSWVPTCFKNGIKQVCFGEGCYSFFEPVPKLFAEEWMNALLDIYLRKNGT